MRRYAHRGTDRVEAEGGEGEAELGVPVSVNHEFAFYQPSSVRSIQSVVRQSFYVLGGDAEVRGHGQAEARADCRALHGGNDRYGQPPDGEKHLVCCVVGVWGCGKQEGYVKKRRSGSIRLEAQRTP